MGRMVVCAGNGAVKSATNLYVCSVCGCNLLFK